MIHKKWWKYLGALLVLYSLVGGMLVPLKPGISFVTPSAVKSGEQFTVKVQGYNSLYTKAKNGEVRAWLKMDDHYSIQAEKVTLVSDRELELVFTLPQLLPVATRVQDFTLLIDHPYDGASVLPSAVFVRQDSLNPQAGIDQWPQGTIANLNEKAGIHFPYRNILGETIRSVFFHVPLWFSMIILFLASLISSIQYLRKQEFDADGKTYAYNLVGLLFGLLGLVTGAVWAKYTWGKPWSWDIKQITTLITIFIYLAYFLLRSFFDDEQRKARLSAVYNIFAFATLIPLLFVIPRMTDSLHPGNGGNPALGGEDLDNTMRLFFYPGVIGWILLGFWMASLWFRYRKVTNHLEEI